MRIFFPRQIRCSNHVVLSCDAMLPLKTVHIGQRIKQTLVMCQPISRLLTLLSVYQVLFRIAGQIILCVWVFCLPLCSCTISMLHYQGDQQRALDPLELELHTDGCESLCGCLELNQALLLLIVHSL